MANAHTKMWREDDRDQIQIVLKNFSGKSYFRLQITGRRGWNLVSGQSHYIILLTHKIILARMGQPYIIVLKP